MGQSSGGAAESAPKKKQAKEVDDGDPEKGSSAGDDIGDEGMKSNNPYAQAIGAAFKVLGARNKRQRERTAAMMNSVNAQQGNMAKGAQAMTSVASGYKL